jgi:nitrogen-specific signal transduction histidine kinase/CheY-like chemotaxis protein
LINEEVEGFVVTFVDITERKKSEAITKAAIIEAQNANMAKSEFLSRMSHELRTPLNAILGFAQLMQMGDLNPHHQKGVQYILKSGKHLLKLINEVLDITRIESGNFSILSENIQLREFAEEIVGMVQPLAGERQIKLENVILSEDQLFVYTDPGKLKQIWMNLLSNAIKYNKPGGTVRIVTECSHDLVSGTDHIRTSFIDTGYGITPENIKKLFIPFERVGAEKYNVEGTGLGLSVVKTLVDAMGLKMGLESVPDEGSIFWIEMPLSEDPCHNEVLFAGAGREGLPDIRIKGTILYVEDKLANVELVGEIIFTHRPEIRLVEANCGDNAVELAIEFSPDMVLIAIDLNDINGIQAFDNLQSDPQTKNIPVVVLASDAVVHRAEKMMDAGAQSYLTKPLDIISFLKVVDQWI